MTILTSLFSAVIGVALAAVFAFWQGFIRAPFLSAPGITPEESERRLRWFAPSNRFVCTFLAVLPPLCIPGADWQLVAACVAGVAGHALSDVFLDLGVGTECSFRNPSLENE